MSELLILIGIIFVILIAILSVFFSSLLDRVRNPTIRAVLPLVCGIVLLVFFLILDPLPESALPPFLYGVKTFGLLLLLPLFILAPLPIIEKKTGITFEKIPIFFGSAVTTVYFFIVSRNGMHMLTGQWQAGGPVWTTSAVVLSFLLFIGIYFLQRYFSDSPEETQEKPGTNGNTVSGIGTKNIIVVAVWLLILVSPFFLLDDVAQPTPCTGFSVSIIDQNQTANGTIIHLTDEDLLQYPRLATVIRDFQKDAGNPAVKTGKSGTDPGEVAFSCNEQYQIDKYRRFAGNYAGSANNVYLEYNGTFYSAGQVWIT